MEQIGKVCSRGVFSELVGVQAEMSLPNDNRRCIWFSGDATPTCFAGINWSTREFFCESPDRFISPFLPKGRMIAHINEIEYLVEIACAVMWGEDEDSLVLCGITDNTCSNMWLTKGHARKGAGLRLTRVFHHWVLQRHFRFFSFYCRSEHNFSADFLSRSSEEDIAHWAYENQLARVHDFSRWYDFCSLNYKLKWNSCCDGDIPGSVPIPITLCADNRIMDGCVLEWQPSNFSLCGVAKCHGITGCWIEPRHSRMARILTKKGVLEWNYDPINLVGGFAKDLVGARQFWEVYRNPNCAKGFLVTPRLLDLTDAEFTPFSSHCSVDSAVYGDLIAGRWNLYAFGAFDLKLFLSLLKPVPPKTLAGKYRDLGFEAMQDDSGLFKPILLTAQWGWKFT